MTRQKWRGVESHPIVRARSLRRLTPFSYFSLQTLTMAEGNQWFNRGANTVVFCLVAVWFGHALALRLNSMKGI